MSEETAYLPILYQGHKVAELTVHVRGAYDETFPDDLAAEVFFEDEAGKRHATNAATSKEILDRIKSEQPDIWDKIRDAAEADFIEGCDWQKYEPEYIGAITCPR